MIVKHSTEVVELSTYEQDQLMSRSAQKKRKEEHLSQKGANKVTYQSRAVVQTYYTPYSRRRVFEEPLLRSVVDLVE